MRTTPLHCLVLALASTLVACGDSGGAGGAGGTSGGSCGNGMINPPEQCDGAQLNGATCMTMNMGTGMLQCSSSCTYNTAMCTGGTSTGGTGGGGRGGS